MFESRIRYRSVPYYCSSLLLWFGLVRFPRTALAVYFELYFAWHGGSHKHVHVSGFEVVIIRLLGREICMVRPAAQ
ncbi:hypothetical protein GGS20DRAFT_556977 [Poronia punctata]|nr:hypothetical protein GGS20DRAFT_556977 [Poronia punctata]